VARPPSVFVRELTPDGGRRLGGVSRRHKQYPIRQRAQILLASATGMAAGQIAQALSTDENQVRRVIGEFNEDGMASLRPRIGGGRPRRSDQSTMVDAALARPGDLGEAGTRWTLRRLRRYLIRSKKVVSVSVEGLRQVLSAAGVTYQRTRTWKTSNDALYEAKKAWVTAAYKAAEAGTLDGVLVSFDECGPISLRPWPGSCWARQKQTQLTRATYRRLMGVRYLFGAYDVGADKLWGVLRAKKDASVVLAFLKDIRRRYPPDTQLYIVMDNLSTHWTPDIRTWAGTTMSGCWPRPPTPAGSIASNVTSGPSSNWSSTTATTPTGPPSTRRPSSTSQDATETDMTPASANSKQGSASHDLRITGVDSLDTPLAPRP
jgi:transposase